MWPMSFLFQFCFIIFKFVGKNSLITSCEESTKTDANVYVDFQNISRSCTCTVMALFTGDLLVYATLGKTCNEKVTVNSSTYIAYFNCDDTHKYPPSSTFSVRENYTTDAVNVIAEYTKGFPSEVVYPCLLFKRNGILIFNI